jgi:NOL1/NOP2/fmu family ribosome biogenesis protein
MAVIFIYRNEREKLLKKLEYYGIKELPYLITLSGKEKIRGYSGILSGKEINDIDNTLRVEVLGLYLFHDYEDGIRLSFDAINAFSKQITKNIIDLNDKQASEILKGKDLLFSVEEKEQFKNEPKGFKILRYKGEFIGSGKISNERLISFMPKERRFS